MDRVELFALMALFGPGCSRASNDHHSVDTARIDAGPPKEMGGTDATSPSNNVDAGASKVADVEANIPPRWVGSWHTVYGRSAFSGRSLCLVVEDNGRFNAEEWAIEFRPSSKPCGGHFHCKIAGQMTLDGDHVRFTYERPSCGIRLPRSDLGVVSMLGKVLSFRFERGGLFGALESFGMVAGACPNQPAECRGDPGSSSSRRNPGDSF